jgi:hypothetical protein
MSAEMAEVGNSKNNPHNDKANGSRGARPARKRRTKKEIAAYLARHPHPPCRVCGKDVVRKPKQSFTDWSKQLTCSPECRLELTVDSMAAIQGDPVAARKPHPPCVICDGPVLRKEGELRKVWRNRKTCSPECLSKLRARLVIETNARIKAAHREKALLQPHPPCIVCAGPVTCRDHEDPSQWQRRKTCSPACVDKLREPKKKPKPTKKQRPNFKSAKPAKQITIPAGHVETVEEALARGLIITRIENPVHILGGVPVRYKTSTGTGRV